jgi:hypothetical protein
MPNSDDSFEIVLQRAREAIVTPSQAVNMLTRLAELLTEEGQMVRGAAILRSLEVLIGEPYRPRPGGGADVVRIPNRSEPEP